MKTDLERGRLSATRRTAGLAALAVGGFGIGLNEFVPIGLLPQMARALQPDECCSGSA